MPTGAANAIKATEVRLEPLVGQDVERNDELPYMGHQGVMLTENHVRLSFQVDFAGPVRPGPRRSSDRCFRPAPWRP